MTCTRCRIPYGIVETVFTVGHFLCMITMILVDILPVLGDHPMVMSAELGGQTLRRLRAGQLMVHTPGKIMT